MRQKSAPTERNLRNRLSRASAVIRIVLGVCAVERVSPSFAGSEGIVQNLYYRWSKEFLRFARLGDGRLWPDHPSRSNLIETPS